MGQPVSSIFKGQAVQCLTSTFLRSSVFYRWTVQLFANSRVFLPWHLWTCQALKSLENGCDHHCFFFEQRFVGFFFMCLKLRSFILPLCNNPPAHPHYSSNISDLRDVCQHFVVLLCNMEFTATAHSKKFTLLLLLLSQKWSLRKYCGSGPRSLVGWHDKMTLQGVMHEVLFTLAVFWGPEGLNDHEGGKDTCGNDGEGF